MLSIVAFLLWDRCWYSASHATREGPLVVTVGGSAMICTSIARSPLEADDKFQGFVPPVTAAHVTYERYGYKHYWLELKGSQKP